MKDKYLTLILAAAALAFTACSSDDDVYDNLASEPVAARVVANITNGQSLTRVSTTGETSSFESNDVINVVAAGTIAYQYTYDGSSEWTATTPYYFTSTDAVSFKGWYSTATAESNSISINTTTQTTDDAGYNQWDILVTPAVTATYSSHTVNFTSDNAFQHIMSKMTFTFSAGNGITDLTNLSAYTLKSVPYTQATFNTLTCTLTNTESSSADISQTITGAAETSIACTPIILLPQTLTDGKFTLQVTYDSKTYSAELALPSSASALVAGNHYKFAVTISNSGLTVQSAAIADWTANEQSGTVTLTE